MKERLCSKDENASDEVVPDGDCSQVTVSSNVSLGEARLTLRSAPIDTSGIFSFHMSGGEVKFVDKFSRHFRQF